jgi:hypothetical protein
MTLTRPRCGRRGWLRSETVECEVLSRVRAICLAFPKATERLSHGAPTFFVGNGGAFVNAWIGGHHDHTFPHLWCAAPAGAQEALVAEDPGTFFRPPYVGHRGWLGVRLDRGVEDEQLADLCEDAYRTVAPANLRKLLTEERDG